MEQIIIKIRQATPKEAKDAYKDKYEQDKSYLRYEHFGGILDGKIWICLPKCQIGEIFQTSLEEISKKGKLNG